MKLTTATSIRKITLRSLIYHTKPLFHHYWELRSVKNAFLRKDLYGKKSVISQNMGKIHFSVGNLDVKLIKRILLYKQFF